jgi:pilus assembly protein Flp/PilA
LHERSSRETLSLRVDNGPTSRRDNLPDLEINMLTKFIRDEQGATAIEYGLIASLIAVIIIAAVALVGTNLTATFNSIANHI